MTDDEIIAVVQAHKEGKKIQGKSAHHSNVWVDLITEPVIWDFMYKEYRVAPEPRKPREWWAEIPTDGSVGQIFTDSLQLTKGGELVRVREVIDAGWPDGFGISVGCR